MPDPDIVEAVARAVFAEQLAREDDSEKPMGWDDAHPKDHVEAVALARAALIAHEASLAERGMVTIAASDLRVALDLETARSNKDVAERYFAIGRLRTALSELARDREGQE